MTVKLISFSVLVALPMCVLAGPSADLMASPATTAATASAGVRFLNGKTAALAQTQEPQSAQDPNGKKRKSVHEYGPEDLLPQAQETEASRPNRGPVPPGSLRPKIAPRAPVAVPAPLPAAPSVITAPTPATALSTAPTISATPFQTSTPTPQAITPDLPAPAASIPATTEKPAASVSNRSTLILVAGLFLAALLALVYFVLGFVRELRAKNENAIPEPPVTESIRVRVDAQPAVVESIKRGEKPAKNMKNKMRKARYN